MISILRFLLKIGTFGVFFIVFLGFLGFVHPFFDTLSHFRLHFSAGLLVVIVVLIFFKMFKTASLALLVSVIGLISVSSGTIFSKQVKTARAELPVYTLFHFNLLAWNDSKDAVIDKITTLNPDIITLTEQSPAWRKLFNKLQDRWPYVFQCRDEDQFSATAIYSKWPMVRETEFCGPYGSLARVDAKAPDGSEVSLIASHFRWPWPASGPRQLEKVLPEIKKFGPDALVAGDFNATTWSYALEKFATAGNLKVVAGIGPTWMLKIPVFQNWFWAGLPIDNIFHKGRIEVLSATTLEELGSDHLPILVQFQINAQ